jgi:hypothetical protein
LFPLSLVNMPHVSAKWIGVERNRGIAMNRTAAERIIMRWGLIVVFFENIYVDKILFQLFF